MKSALAVIDSAFNTSAPEQLNIDNFGAIKIPFGYGLETDITTAWKSHTSGLPANIKRKLYLKLKNRIERDNEKPLRVAVDSVKYAIGNLAEDTLKIKTVINKDHLWLLNYKQIEPRAKWLINQLNTYLSTLVETPADSDAGYNILLSKVIAFVNELLKEIGIKPPLSAVGDNTKLEANISRYQDLEYIQELLERHAMRLHEHIEIIFKNVNKHISPYCSFNALKQFKRKQVQQKEWLESMVVQSEDGDEISLKTAFDASTANPNNRHNELIVRANGLKELAENLGYESHFLTITAPAAYHANAGKRYNGATPRDTQKHLAKTWQKARAKLNRNDIGMFGIRIVEPHADATPHWHMMVFCKPEDTEQLLAIVGFYALQPDRKKLFLNKIPEHKKVALNELADKARDNQSIQSYILQCMDKKLAKARFDAKQITSEKGGALAYLLKYLTKNTNGKNIKREKDHETGKDIGSGIDSVLAWSSLWGIRQFQFFGGAPVTAYREVRRFMNGGDIDQLLNLIGKEKQDFMNLCMAADIGDFGDFVKYSGGVFQGKSGLVKTLFKSEESIWCEPTKKIKGFAFQNTEVNTRLKVWTITKRTDSKGGEADQSQSAGASWSSVNNCTVDSNSILNLSDETLFSLINSELTPEQFNIRVDEINQSMR